MIGARATTKVLQVQILFFRVRVALINSFQKYILRLSSSKDEIVYAEKQ